MGGLCTSLSEHRSRTTTGVAWRRSETVLGTRRERALLRVGRRRRDVGASRGQCRRVEQRRASKTARHTVTNDLTNVPLVRCLAGRAALPPHSRRANRTNGYLHERDRGAAPGRRSQTPRAAEIAMPLTLGSRLGPYEILSPLGAGGMGEVYRAHDTTLSRDVALKILPESFVQDADRL